MVKQAFGFWQVLGSIPSNAKCKIEKKIFKKQVTKSRQNKLSLEGLLRFSFCSPGPEDHQVCPEAARLDKGASQIPHSPLRLPSSPFHCSSLPHLPPRTRLGRVSGPFHRAETRRPRATGRHRGRSQQTGTPTSKGPRALQGEQLFPKATSFPQRTSTKGCESPPMASDSFAGELCVNTFVHIKALKPRYGKT